MVKYFVPLFNAQTSFLAIASATGLTEKIQSELKDFGYHVEVRELPSLGDAESHDDEDGSSGSEHGSEDDGSEDERMSAAGAS
jgi:hypothetical protein